MNKRALLILASAFLLASCGEEGTPTDIPSSSSLSEVKRYTVTFANTNMPSVEIEEGAAHLLELKQLIKKHNESERQNPLREPDLLVIITGGQMAYTRPDGVKIIPLGCLED